MREEQEKSLRDPHEIEREYEQTVEEITSELGGLIKDGEFYKKFWNSIEHWGLKKIAALLYNLGYRGKEGQTKGEVITPEKLSKMRVVDLGGGRISPENEEFLGSLDRLLHGTEVLFSEYPWLSVSLSLLQQHFGESVKPVSVDLPNEIESSNMDKEDIEKILELYHPIGDDLAQVLRMETPVYLVKQYLSNIMRQTPGRAQIVNCHFLLSANPHTLAITSPSFAEALGFRTYNDGTPIIKSDEEKARLGIACNRLIEVAFALLEEGGFFFWNKLLYKKLGDKFVWIPGHHLELGEAAWQKTLKEQSEPDSLAQNPWQRESEGTFNSNWFSWRINKDGSIKKSTKYPDISAPVP